MKLFSFLLLALMLATVPTMVAEAQPHLSTTAVYSGDAKSFADADRSLAIYYDNRNHAYSPNANNLDSPRHPTVQSQNRHHVALSKRTENAPDEGATESSSSSDTISNISNSNEGEIPAPNPGKKVPSQRKASRTGSGSSGRKGTRSANADEKRKQRQAGYVANYDRKLRAQLASDDAAERARAEAVVAQRRAAARHMVKTVSQHISYDAARAVLAPDEWPMFMRLRRCKSDYIVALKVLKELEQKYGLVAKRGRRGGGGGGGGSGGEGWASDPGALESVMPADAARYADARKHWIRGKRCLRWLYDVGQEVSRQSGALGDPQGTPSAGWIELRRTWNRIEDKWDELGESDKPTDEILGFWSVGDGTLRQVLLDGLQLGVAYAANGQGKSANLLPTPGSGIMHRVQTALRTLQTAVMGSSAPRPGSQMRIIAATFKYPRPLRMPVVTSRALVPFAPR